MSECSVSGNSRQQPEQEPMQKTKQEFMQNLSIGDKVGLSWIRGHGNAKIVGVYQDYYMVIHNCHDKPMLVYKSDIVPPEPKEPEIDSSEISPGSPYNDKYKEIRRMIIDDINQGGPIRKAIRDVYG